jgi:hypothetical protein
LFKLFKLVCSPLAASPQPSQANALLDGFEPRDITDKKRVSGALKNSLQEALKLFSTYIQATLKRLEKVELLKV